MSALLIAGCGGQAEQGSAVPVPVTTAVPTATDAAPAEETAPAPEANDPATAEPPVPTETGRSAVASPPFAEPGDLITITGSGWPASNLVTASVCGNNFLNGSVDCDQAGAGQVVAGPDGLFGIQVTVALPPKPCPCVVHVATSADTGTVDIPFEIIGAPTAPPSQLLITRSVDVVASVSGSGPWSAYFGGQAERELVLTLKNTGNQALDGLPLNLTVGKGEDPTTPATTPDGASVQIPPIPVGQTIEVRQPFTIEAPAVGKYTVKGSFIGVDFITVEGERQNVGDLSFRTTTTTYPWALIVLGWLLLQIPLLGLYKRRPVVVEPVPEVDPLADSLVYADGAPVAEGFASGILDPEVPVSGLPAPPPPPPGFQVLTPGTPTGGAALPGSQGWALGVDDLRTIVDQGPGTQAPSDSANPTI